MALIKFNPVLDNFFDGFWGNGENQNFPRKWDTPNVNIKETEDAFKLEVEAPGRKKEDFRLSLDNDVLQIAYETKDEHEEKDEDGKYTRKEFRYESFQRAFTLPHRLIKQDKIDAKYENGILNITIPKMAPKELEKKINLIEIK